MIGRPGCKFCGGEGLIQVNDLTTRLCMCAYAKRMAEKLGPEIAQAPNIVSSPLYVRNTDPGKPPLHDRTTENMFVRGSWPELLPHFKYVLGLKGLDFRFLIITDEKLRNIYVGNESWKARTREEKEDGEVVNSLSDVMSDPHLAIIRLGFLGYKNVAMPGILKESLMIRQAARLPTWLVEDPSSPFEDGHLSYNWEVANYIDTQFKVKLDLTGSFLTAGPSPLALQKVNTPVEVSTMVVEDYEPAVVEGVFEEITPAKKKPFKPKFGSGSWKPKKARASDDFEG